MKFQTYLVAWDEMHFNCVDIAQKIDSERYPLTVINSGNMTREGWHNIGDIRYYRQFHYALNQFDMNYDYMAFLCGDASYDDWNSVLDRAQEVLSSYEVGLYAPHFTNEPWSENSSKVGSTSLDSDINIAIQTDGIYVFIRKDIVKILLEYFNYMANNIDMGTIKSGWGLDMIWSSIAIKMNLPILRDKKFILNHPAGSSYDHSAATRDMNTVLDQFYNYIDYTGGNSIEYKQMHGKIYGRMSRLDGCMNVSDFYDSFSLFKQEPINYHIIYINDERKINREKISKTLNGNQLDIFSLNAKDPDEMNKFNSFYPEFKISWDGFKLGEIGNFGSHYAAWRHVLDSNIDSLLVFEDDALLHEDFMDKYRVIMSKVPSDYDVMSIFIHPNQHDRFNSNDRVNSYIAKGYQDWSTLCYVVSRQGAKNLINYVHTIGMDHPTDWFIFRKGHGGIFNVYTVAPEFPSPLEIDTSYESQVQ